VLAVVAVEAAARDLAAHVLAVAVLVLVPEVRTNLYDYPNLSVQRTLKAN
jgi:hypothetical protein